MSQISKMRDDKIIRMSLWATSRSGVCYTWEQEKNSKLRAAVTHALRKQRVLVQQGKLEKACVYSNAIIAAWCFSEAYIDLFNLCILFKGQKNDIMSSVNLQSEHFTKCKAVKLK